MPENDPKKYYDNAKRCLQLAQDTTNPDLKASLADIAEKWMALAASTEITNQLLAQWAEVLPEARIDANGLNHLVKPTQERANDDSPTRH